MRTEGNDNTYNLPRGEAIRRAMRDIFREQRRAIHASLRTMGHKALTPSESAPPIPNRFPDWDVFGLGALKLTDRMTPLVEAVWDAAGAKFAPRVGLDPDKWSVVNPHTEPQIAAAAFHFCRSTNEATSLQLDDALHRLKVQMIEGVVDEGETLPLLTTRINEIFDKLERRKARTIAQTETSRAVHSAQIAAAWESKVVTGFTWLASADACREICLAIVARCPSVRLGEPFAIIGSNPHYSRIEGPPGHPHCNCSLAEILVTDPQPPQWSNTLYEPHPATDEEIDRMAEAQMARVNDAQRTWDPATGLYGGAVPPAKPKRPRPRPAPKPKPAPARKPRRQAEQETAVVNEPAVPVGVDATVVPGEPIPARDVQPDPIAEMTVEHFADQAVSAAHAVPMDERQYPHKVWIVDAFFQFLKRHPGSTFAQFARALVEANNQRLLSLSRSDMPQALSPDELAKEQASAVTYLRALFHYIRLPQS